MRLSRFTKATYDIAGTDKWKKPLVCLTSDLIYEVDFLGSGWFVTAEKGFCSDLVSIPNFILRFLLKFKWTKAILESMARSAIVHDKLRRDQRHSKILGDWIFFEAMGVDKVKLWVRIIAFAFVLCNFNRT